MHGALSGTKSSADVGTIAARNIPHTLIISIAGCRRSRVPVNTLGTALRGRAIIGPIARNICCTFLRIGDGCTLLCAEACLGVPLAEGLGYAANFVIIEVADLTALGSRRIKGALRVCIASGCRGGIGTIVFYIALHLAVACEGVKAAHASLIKALLSWEVGACALAFAAVNVKHAALSVHAAALSEAARFALLCAGTVHQSASGV